MTLTLPALLPVRNLLEDLLGREVTVTATDPIDAGDLPTTVAALYVDNAERLVAVVGLELSLAAYAGAALGLMPAGGAADSIEEKQLSPMLAENVQELCNVLSGLLNKPGAPHVKLHGVVLPGESMPSDASSNLLAYGRRLDLIVEIARYGKGTFTLVLTD